MEDAVGGWNLVEKFALREPDVEDANSDWDRVEKFAVALAYRPCMIS